MMKLSSIEELRQLAELGTSLLEAVKSSGLLRKKRKRRSNPKPKRTRKVSRTPVPRTVRPAGLHPKLQLNDDKEE